MDGEKEWQWTHGFIKRSGQRGQPIKPPKKSPADLDRMAKEYERVKRAEYKDKAIQMLETMSQEAPYHVTSFGNFPEDFIRKMFSKMACQWCNFIPSPYRRYICPDGHLFCAACGEDRFIKHGGKCMTEATQAPTELNHAKKEAHDGPSSTLLVPVTSGPYHWMDGSKHFPVCQRKIRLYAADPVFASMWVNAVWKCPGGCNEAFQGRDLLQHLMCCVEEKTSQSEASDEISPEENSLVLVSVPEKDDPTVKLSKGVECIVSGCSKQILFKDVVEHVILSHSIYAMYAGGDEQHQRTMQKAGLLYVPQSNIEARRPYYTLIRYSRRFFLFCMEPSPQNSIEVGFWIRRISNMENKEEENGPCFKYDLFMADKFRDMQVIYNNSCIPWRKPSSEVFEEMQCMTTAVPSILDRWVRIIEDNDSGDIDEDDEKGYLPVNFRILVENAVEDFNFDEMNEPVTSSMESLAIVSTCASAIITSASEVSEVTNEVDSKDGDAENDEVDAENDEVDAENDEVDAENDDVDADEDGKEEGGTHQLGDNGIAVSHKIKMWFETNCYKDEVFSCHYSP